LLRNRIDPAHQENMEDRILYTMLQLKKSGSMHIKLFLYLNGLTCLQLYCLPESLSFMCCTDVPYVMCLLFILLWESYTRYIKNN